MSSYITVVFEINDIDTFYREVPGLHTSMLNPTGSPWRVTAMSLDDEITRLGILEEALNHDDTEDDTLRDILSAGEIWSKKLEDFL